MERLAEKFAEETQRRVRVAHSRFRPHSVRDVGFPGSPAFFANRCGFLAGLCQANPNYNWSSEVNGSIGFVVNGLWSINSRHDRRQRNQAYRQDNDDPVEALHRTPQIRHKLLASKLSCQCATAGIGLSSTNDAWGPWDVGWRTRQPFLQAHAIATHVPSDTPYCLARSMADCQNDSGNFVRP
jgi:hypothetical protein